MNSPNTNTECFRITNFIAAHECWWVLFQMAVEWAFGETILCSSDAAIALFGFSRPKTNSLRFPHRFWLIETQTKAQAILLVYIELWCTLITLNFPYECFNSTFWTFNVVFFRWTVSYPLRRCNEKEIESVLHAHTINDRSFPASYKNM